jgi:hypothetical protein
MWILSIGVQYVRRLPAIDENLQNQVKEKGHAMAQPVKALRYKLVGRGFDSR